MDPVTALRTFTGVVRFFPRILKKIVVPFWYKVKRWLRPQHRRVSFPGFEKRFVFGFKLRTSWGEIEHYLLTREKEVASLGFSVAIGTGVGGSILAALVVGNLGQNAVVIGIDRQERYLEGHREVTLCALPSEGELSKLIKGKIVIAVSAELVSGGTTELLLDEIRKHAPRRIYTLCIDWHEASKVTPNFWYNYIASGPKDKYNIIHKPWKISPTYIVGDMKQRPS